MRVDYREQDLYVLRGVALDSNAAVLAANGRALIVDGMGSRDDAAALRVFVTGELGLAARFVIATHYFSDHMAALALFPEAEIVAHELYRHTFDSELHRTEEERSFFVRPTLLVRDGFALHWGRFHVDIFHNPGHTMSTLGVDVPEADLLFVGDTVVSNIGYFAYTTPELIATAIRRAQRRGRGRILASHGGPVPAAALEHVLHYLSTLGRRVAVARGQEHSEQAIRAITLEECLSPGLLATDFERLFHGRNLASVIERRLYD